jgi:hypothetical protein
VPLESRLTGGRVTQLLPLVDRVGPVTGEVGRPRKKAERLIGDRGYDHDNYRRRRPALEWSWITASKRSGSRRR